jgi:hypothetical protein
MSIPVAVYPWPVVVPLPLPYHSTHSTENYATLCLMSTLMGDHLGTPSDTFWCTHWPLKGLSSLTFPCVLSLLAWIGHQSCLSSLCVCVCVLHQYLYVHGHSLILITFTLKMEAAHTSKTSATLPTCIWCTDSGTESSSITQLFPL